MFYLLYKTFSNTSAREQLFFIGAFIIFFLSGAFVIINAYYAATREIPAFGGTYTEGIVGQPVFINPLIANGNEADYSAIALLFSNFGDLIKTYTASPDKKIWTVTLKKDLRWDDGKNLTADDIVFTVETIQDQNTHTLLAAAWQGVIIEKINDDEVRFTLKAPYGFFLDTLQQLIIAPQHIFGAIPPANLRLSKYNLEPVGNGPYMFSALTSEKDGFITAMKFVPNPRYHDTQPFIQQFTVRFYRNEQSIINDFNSKKIDGLGGIDPAIARELVINHRLATMSVPRYYAIFFNAQAHPALKEKTVRQALALMINRTALVDTVFNGYAAIVQGPIPPTIMGYDSAAYPAPQTAAVAQEQARRLLDDNGWLIDPADGVRYKITAKNKVKLQFDIITPDIPFITKTMDNIKKEFAALGVKANLVIMGVDEINKNALKTRNYQMIIFGNILKNNPDVFSFWHSSQKFYPGLNLALYDNKTLDALLETIRQETHDDTRRAMISRVQKILYDDAPAAFLFNPTYLYAIPAHLQGFTATSIATPAERFTHVNKWHLKTKRVFTP